MPDTPNSSRFAFRTTPIAGVLEVELLPVGDHRGVFARLFDAEIFAARGLFSKGAVQTNFAVTREAGTVRGLHWQDQDSEGPGEAKLVMCVAGRAFDVAVDFRTDSPTRLQHHAVELTPMAWRALLIPPGVAHGMQAVEDNTALTYHTAAPFNPSLERGARPDDPALGIEWPLPVRNLSDRDRTHPLISVEADGFRFSEKGEE